MSNKFIASLGAFVFIWKSGKPAAGSKTMRKINRKVRKVVVVAAVMKKLLREYFLGVNKIYLDTFASLWVASTRGRKGVINPSVGHLIITCSRPDCLASPAARGYVLTQNRRTQCGADVYCPWKTATAIIICHPMGAVFP